MNININNLVSMSEANQNFLKIVRMVDENGVAVILKNNKPRYDYLIIRMFSCIDYYLQINEFDKVLMPIYTKLWYR